MLSRAVILLSLVVGPIQQQPPPASAPVMTVEEASLNGLIELSVAGNGGSSGDVVTLTVKRTVRRPLRLRLAAGTVLRSASAAVQNMIVAGVRGELIDAERYRPTDTIELPDDRSRVYLVEAYCLDFDKENPGASDRFSIAAVDGPALSLIRAVQKSTPSAPIIQAALWLAAGVQKSAIQERFNVSDTDLLLAEAAVVLWKNP
jgi:hypothetical protein